MMTGRLVREYFAALGARSVRLPSWYAEELLCGRYPVRGVSRLGTIVLLDARVVLVSPDAWGWRAVVLPMPAWWGMLAGHRHGMVRLMARGGAVALCVFCGLCMDVEHAPA